MARHRIGNTYLSDKEYEDEIDNRWIGALFLIGAISGGVSAYYLSIHLEFFKVLKFAAIIIGAFVVGTIFVRLEAYIRIGLGITFGVGFLSLIGYLIWLAI